MAYTTQTWSDGAGGGTPIDAAHLTHIEAGVKDADNRLATVEAGKAPLVHTHPVTDLTATGTASSSTYLRGDGTWSTPAAGSGAVSSVNGKTGVVVLAATDVSAQPAAAELTTIAGLTHANDTILQTKAGSWVASTPAQVKNDLALAKGDVGLGNVDNTSDVNKPVSTSQQAALDGKAAKLTPTTTKTSAYTATTGDLVVCDATSAAFTVTMPAATAGAIIGIRKDDASANVVTIARNGTDVFGAVNTVTSLTLDIPRQVVTLIGIAGAWIPSAGIPTPRTLPDIQVFTTSGTWTKPAGATKVTVAVIGGGGGGGSGRRVASGTGCSGGGGGAGGGYSNNTFRAADLGSTEAATVGTGGAGGAAIAVNDTNGVVGGNGGASVFGTSSRVRANGGTGGGAGATSAPGAAAGGVGLVSGSIGAAAVSGAAGAGGSTGANFLAGAGGASGGGISATPTAFAGGTGGTVLQLGSTGSGTAGAIDGAGGAGTAAPTNMTLPGGGGGGGGSSISGPGGAGGAGGLYGSAGGGGGASLNGFTSGAGGNGAGGLVVVFSE